MSVRRLLLLVYAELSVERSNSRRTSSNRTDSVSSPFDRIADTDKQTNRQTDRRSDPALQTSDCSAGSLTGWWLPFGWLATHCCCLACRSDGLRLPSAHTQVRACDGGTARHAQLTSNVAAAAVIAPATLAAMTDATDHSPRLRQLASAIDRLIAHSLNHFATRH